MQINNETQTIRSTHESAFDSAIGNSMLSQNMVNGAPGTRSSKATVGTMLICM
jgi:hypothetical protein